MSRMVRKQIYISAEQEHLLKTRASELGLTESQLIRSGIERFLRPSGAPPLDEQAWQDAVDFMRERARIAEANEQRGWTREELYERHTPELSD